MEATGAALSAMVLARPPLEVLNAAVDVVMPVYTLAVLCLLVSVHRHQRKLAQGLSPGEDEDAYLVQFEQELLAAAKAAAARKEQEEASRRKREAAQNKQQGAAAASVAGSAEARDAAAARRDFSGVWKSIPAKNVNYDEFLTVQGVPFIKRKVATSTVVTHTIEHVGDQFKLEVQPLNMKTTFNIGGAPTVSYIGKKAFEDKMTWGPHGELVLVKSNAEDGTEVTAVRALSEDGRFLTMAQCVKNLKDGKETRAEQTFEKAG